MKVFKQMVAIPIVMVFMVSGWTITAGAEGENPNLGGMNAENIHQEYYNYEPGVSTHGETTLPSKYDLRQEGQSTAVRYQNPFSSCWSFGALSSVESNILKQTGEDPSTMDLSERQLAWFVYDGIDQGSVSQEGEGIIITSGRRMDMGGNRDDAVGHLVTWNGATTEAIIPYTNRAGEWSPDPNDPIADSDWSLDGQDLSLSAVHIQNADYLPSPATFKTVDNTTGESSDYEYSPAATEAIKEALMTKGAVEISYCANESSPNQEDTTSPFWNGTTNAQYAYTWVEPNHSVSIVGWDDDYPATNFSKEAPGNGAFIVKNSWSNRWGDQGYFYLSYYDQSMVGITSYGTDLRDENGLFDYDTNYQYDYDGLKSVQKLTGLPLPLKNANAFTAVDDEALKAVSAVTMAPGSTVNVEIHRMTDANNPESGEVLLSQSQTFNYGGFHTITLNEPITLSPGETFSVIQEIIDSNGKYYLSVETGTGDYTYLGFSPQSQYKNVATAKAGESFIKEGETWTDVTQQEPIIKGEMTMNFGNAMIKAYTTNLASVLDISVEGFDGSKASLGSQTLEENTVKLSEQCQFLAVTPTVEEGGTVTILLGEKEYAAGELMAVEEIKAQGFQVKTANSRGDVLIKSYTVATVLPTPSPSVTPTPSSVPQPSADRPQGTTISQEKTAVKTGIQGSNTLPMMAVLLLLAAAGGVLLYQQTKKR